MTLFSYIPVNLSLIATPRRHSLLICLVSLHKRESTKSRRW